MRLFGHPDNHPKKPCGFLGTPTKTNHPKKNFSFFIGRFFVIYNFSPIFHNNGSSLICQPQMIDEMSDEKMKKYTILKFRAGLFRLFLLRFYTNGRNPWGCVFG